MTARRAGDRPHKTRRESFTIVCDRPSSSVHRWVRIPKHHAPHHGRKVDCAWPLPRSSTNTELDPTPKSTANAFASSTMARSRCRATSAPRGDTAGTTPPTIASVRIGGGGYTRGCSSTCGRAEGCPVETRRSSSSRDVSQSHLLGGGGFDEPCRSSAIIVPSAIGLPRSIGPFLKTTLGGDLKATMRPKRTSSGGLE